MTDKKKLQRIIEYIDKRIVEMEKYLATRRAARGNGKSTMELVNTTNAITIQQELTALKVNIERWEDEE